MGDIVKNTIAACDLAAILHFVAEKNLSKNKVAGFALAYADAKNLALQITETEYRDLIPKMTSLLMPKIATWGELIEPQNRQGWRTGRHLVYPDIIDHKYIVPALEDYCTAFLSWDPLWCYQRFLKIRPFWDGNARLAYLLWAIRFTRHNHWPHPTRFPHF